MKNVNFTSDKLTFSVDKNIYSAEVLTKCLYWYGASFEVEILQSESQQEINICLYCKQGPINGNVIAKIRQDLIDFRLRDMINKETNSIRELLIAKAFSHYEDQDPRTEISDPVGFSPHDVPL